LSRGSRTHDDESRQALQRAVELGCTFFDQNPVARVIQNAHGILQELVLSMLIRILDDEALASRGFMQNSISCDKNDSWQLRFK